MTFTDPEVARVGLTEDEARNKYRGTDVGVRFVPMERVDRAVPENDTAVFVKVVHGKDGTAPDERFDDREQRRSAFGMVGVRLKAGDALRSCQEGSVGCRSADFVLHQHGATIPTRFTAIMQQENGEWRLVQTHFCIDVPDEEAAT